MLYDPNLPSKFQLRGLCAITKPNSKDPEHPIVVTPAEAFADFEATGPGAVDGDVDLEIRSRNNTVEIIAGGRTRETVNPTGYQYDLYHWWFEHKDTRWNVTVREPTGETDEDGHPVFRERDLERTAANLDKKLHIQHRADLQLRLARNFYPEIFGTDDPNSSDPGKSGTSGTSAGSKPGSSSDQPSNPRRSASPASSSK